MSLSKIEEMENWILDFYNCAQEGYDLGKFDKPAHPRWGELLDRLHTIVLKINRRRRKQRIPLKESHASQEHSIFIPAPMDPLDSPHPGNDPRDR